MEISEGELRPLTSAADEHHAATHSPARRSLLKKSVVGAGLVTIGQVIAPASWWPNWLGGVANAAEAEAETTTTAAPVKKALTDKDLCVFARGMEFAAVESYQIALTANVSGKLKTQNVIDTATQFTTHHLDAATAFGDLVSIPSDRMLANAPIHANMPLLRDVTGQLRAADSETALLAVLYELEVAVAGTYLLMLGLTDGATVVAQTTSVLPIASQHAAVIGQILGYGTSALDKLIPDYEKVDAAVDPTGKYAMADSADTISAKDPK